MSRCGGGGGEEEKRRKKERKRWRSIGRLIGQWCVDKNPRLQMHLTVRPAASKTKNGLDMLLPAYN